MAQTEQERQQLVEKNKENCQHVGYYVGFGMEIIPMLNGQIQVITGQNCMMCGETFVKMAVVGKEQQPIHPPKNDIVLPGKN